MKNIFIATALLILYPMSAFAINLSTGDYLWEFNFDCSEHTFNQQTPIHIDMTDTSPGPNCQDSDLASGDIELQYSHEVRCNNTQNSQISSSYDSGTGGGGDGLRLPYTEGTYPNPTSDSPDGKIVLSLNTNYRKVWIAWEAKYPADHSIHHGKDLYLFPTPIGNGQQFHLWNSAGTDWNVARFGTYTCLNGCSDGTESLNLNDATWHHYEVYFEVKTGTNAGILARFWLDGVLIEQYESSSNPATQAGISTIEMWQSWGPDDNGGDSCGEFFVDSIRIAGENYASFVQDANANDMIGPPSGAPGGDTTDPTVSITSPTSNPTYDNGSTQTINLSGSASDETALSDVTWTCAQCSPISGTASGTTSWSISSIGLAPGSNVIDVKATDTSGNTATDTITVTYTPSVGPDISGFTLLINDGFEDGTTGNWQSPFFYQAGGATVQGTTVYSGSYALQLPAGNPGVHVFTFSPAYAELVIEGRVRFSSSTTGTGKIFEYANFNGQGGTCTGAGAGSKPNTWAPWYGVYTVNPADNKPLNYWVRSDGLTVSPYVCDETQTDGLIWQNLWQNQSADFTFPYDDTWHLVQIKVVVNTLGTADGTEEHYVDGVLRGSHTGINFRGSYNDGWNMVMLQNYGTTAGNLFLDDVKLYGLTEADNNPPGISDSYPSSAVSCTDPVEFGLQTHENAICKWDTSDVAYDSMSNTFSITDTTVHTEYSTLTCNQAHTIYVRCMDDAGNKNTSSEAISFTVNAAATGSCGFLTTGGGSLGVDASGSGSAAFNP